VALAALRLELSPPLRANHRPPFLPNRGAMVARRRICGSSLRRGRAQLIDTVPRTSSIVFCPHPIGAPAITPLIASSAARN